MQAFDKTPLTGIFCRRCCFFVSFSADEFMCAHSCFRFRFQLFVSTKTQVREEAGRRRCCFSPSRFESKFADNGVALSLDFGSFLALLVTEYGMLAIHHQLK